MNDKELLLDVISIYLNNTVKSILNINLGIASTALIKISLNNIVNKKSYKVMVDILFNDEGNLPDSKVFFNACREMINDNPVIIYNIKFSSKDVDEIEKLFNSYK